MRLAVDAVAARLGYSSPFFSGEGGADSAAATARTSVRSGAPVRRARAARSGCWVACNAAMLLCCAVCLTVRSWVA